MRGLSMSLDNIAGINTSPAKITKNSAISVPIKVDFVFIFYPIIKIVLKPELCKG